MNGTKYCMGCMQKLTWDGRCQFCDYDEKEYVENGNHLPPRTSLKNGEYLVGRTLGEGGFGITYIGLDTALLQRVAIKEYFPMQMAERRGTEGEFFRVSPSKEEYEKRFLKGLEAFLREGRSLARFGSLDGVVGVKAFFRENNTAYLVMDYVDGVGVRDYIASSGVMKPETVFEMVRQVILDLQRIHEEHILHRDVSVDNLIIDRNGKMTLIDFGAARNLMGMEGRTETILCKQGYSALEQYSANGEQGPWTDVYGLCASLYYMLTGITPESATERIVDDRVKRLSEIIPDSENGERLEAVWRGMAVDRKIRYQSMAELYRAVYGEEITEAIPSANRAAGMPAAEFTHSLGKNILSRTRLQRELSQVSKRRERNRQRKRLALVALLAAAVALTGVWVSAGRMGRRDSGPNKVTETAVPRETPESTGKPLNSQNKLESGGDTAKPQASSESGGNTARPQTPSESVGDTAKPQASSESGGKASKKDGRTARPQKTEKPAAVTRKPKNTGKPKSTPKVTKKPGKKATPKPLKLPEEKKSKKKTTPKPLKLPGDSHDSNVAGDLDSLGK